LELTEVVNGPNDFQSWKPRGSQHRVDSEEEKQSIVIDPIFVAGTGPTEMTAALELSRFGIPVLLIEKREAPAGPAPIALKHALSSCLTTEVLKQRLPLFRIRIGTSIGFRLISPAGMRVYGRYLA
jgi:hypothetical protein